MTHFFCPYIIEIFVSFCVANEIYNKNVIKPAETQGADCDMFTYLTWLSDDH